MDKFLIIGDCHGKLEELKQIIDSNQECCMHIQIGDLGFERHHKWFLDNIDTEKTKVLFGNHDYYPMLNEKHSLGDFYYFEGADIFCIRGADSIDRQLRTVDVTWFAEEEIKYKDWVKIFDSYKEVKPRIVVSHDCPQYVREHMFNIYDKTLTSLGLQNCWELHKPDIWIFGHHHNHIDFVINGTRFICLEELETYKLSV